MNFIAYLEVKIWFFVIMLVVHIREKFEINWVVKLKSMRVFEDYDLE